MKSGEPMAASQGKNLLMVALCKKEAGASSQEVGLILRDSKAFFEKAGLIQARDDVRAMLSQIMEGRVAFDGDNS